MEAAKRIGVDPSTVRRWVSGDRAPSPAMADLIADALVVDMDFVLSLLDIRPASFDVDPDSPEAQPIPLIRQVDWASRPGRLEEMQAELRCMIEVDRKRRKEKR